MPMTSQWQVEVGSAWETQSPPATEYYLGVAQAHHESMEAHGAYNFMKHLYFKAMAWSTDGDFRRLAHGCTCKMCR